MKITVYTISNCPFSRQEKDYLKANNLPYEEKNLEMNREWLAEMLAISNNFAGTPVTRIEDDQGQIRILKGFTKEEFDEVLGLKPREEAKPASEMNNQVTPPPVANQSVSNQPSPSDQAPSSTQSAPSAQPNNPNQQTQPLSNLPTDQQDQQLTADQNLTNDFNPPVPPPPPAVPFSQDQAAPQEPSFTAGQDIGQANQADNNPTPAPPVEDLSAQNPSNPFDLNPAGQPSNPIDQSEQGVANNQPNQTPSNLPNIPDFPGSE